MPLHQSARPAVGKHRAADALSRVLAGGLLVLLGLLLVEVLLEGWLQIRFGARGVDALGVPVVDPLAWPKVLKNGLYLTLAAFTGIKLVVDRRWRDFLTRADVALAVLVVVLVLAGLVGGSSARLIGEALFVYLRGVVVFYAWRSLDPSWRQIRAILATVGGVVALNVVIALVQMMGGRDVYTALGWVDLTWARTSRAHALLTHPNHLGHVLSLTMLAVISLAITRPRLDRRWWLLVGVLALALSATQSRESIVAVAVAAGVIWLLARSHGRRVLVIVAIIGLGSVAQVAIRPSNLAEWQRRLAGVVDAFRVPSGAEPTVTPQPSGEPIIQESAAKVPPREIRVLYYQQGVRLWARKPVLGYGVGHFGGIVAQENDPNWHLNPRLGPGGFDRHGFKSVQVDSFWLHLLVETGTLGVLAYVTWLYLVVLPLLRRTPGSRRIPGLRRLAGPRRTPPTGPDPPERDPDPGVRVASFTYWAIGAVTFVVQVAFLSASLEDPLLPALLFTVVGLAWVIKEDTAAAGGGDAPDNGSVPAPASLSGP